jgi:hypothetical protein
MNLDSTIDASRYLYLVRVEEPQDNALLVVIEEAKSTGLPEDIKVPGAIFTECAPIVSDDTCSAWEVLFDSYVAYSVRNESFVQIDKEEEWVGKLFCTFTKSKFLDYVRTATFASDDYPGRLLHYGINCLNHIVDVVTIKQPIIRQFRPGSAG